MDNVLSFEKIINYIRLNFSSDTRIYLVGGVVRDMILGIPSSDIDFVLTGNVKSISRSISNHFSGDFYPLDEERNTYRVILHDSLKSDMVFDIALMRGESIEEDLSDRDFTINAVALDVTEVDKGIYIDPLDGIGAIKNKIITACGEQSLVNDPVRVLRAIRFSCRFNSVIDIKTKALIIDAVPHLNEISRERVRDEFFKMLGKTYTKECLNVCLRFGLVTSLFPDFENCPADWAESNETINDLNHFLIEPEEERKEKSSCGLLIDTFQEDVCNYLEDVIVSDRSVIKVLNLGILLHQEYNCLINRNIDGEDKSDKLQFFLRKRGADFVLSNREINFLRKLIVNWGVISDSIKTKNLFAPIDVYRFFRSAGDAGIGLCMISCASVRRFSEDTQEKIVSTISLLFGGYWTSYRQVISPQSILDGNDLIREFHLKPGPHFKEYLEALREAQVCGTVKNRDEAISFIKRKVKEFSETEN